MKKLIGICVALLLSAAALAAAREYGQLRLATDLLNSPYSDAKVVARLPANARVEILKRQGAWMRVSNGPSSGWVRLHQVRLGESVATRKSGSDVQVLKSLKSTGKSGGGGIVATTGIRGMSAEQLQNAKPDPAGVQQLERHVASDAAARAFAAEAGLKERAVAPLNKP
jgi:hypothetical protein